MIILKDQTNPVLVGVFLVYMMSMNSSLLNACEALPNIERMLMSYERCLKITEIPQEAPQYIPHSDKPNWPSSGHIQFKNLSLKYRPNTQTVLNNLSFSIRNGEKIGVIGRTGAGKSTLCLALCRIVEAQTGSILIDGTDIGDLGLEHLRRHITIIPQEATLFNETLRFNLDPDNSHSDSDLIELIKQASLEKVLERDEKGLLQQIEEGGQNLSSGEQQLL